MKRTQAVKEARLVSAGLSVKTKPGCHKRLAQLTVLNHALVQWLHSYHSALLNTTYTL